MKVLDLRKAKFYLSTKPIYLMGFVIFGVLATSAIFATWVLKYEKYTFLGLPSPRVSNWGILIAALVAMVGWLVTSIITTRNSIKQHTVTTLLQTRLSVEYMKQATIVNSLLEGDSNLQIGSEFYKNMDQANKAAISYIFNYVEFISAGLRLGDFDNQLLKNTMKGIFTNLYKRCEPFIKDMQINSPKTMEHFTFVCETWIRDEEYEKFKRKYNLLQRCFICMKKKFTNLERWWRKQE